MQPLVKEVQRKHKGNRQKVYEETQALYREHGVNPAAGCLPVVLQLPILFALYQALIRASGVVTGFTVNAGNQVAYDQLQAAGLIEAGTKSGEYIVQISGPCNLPAFGTLPQFLPLNCQLINPVKLSAAVDTRHRLRPWTSRASTTSSRSRSSAVSRSPGWRSSPRSCSSCR